MQLHFTGVTHAHVISHSKMMFFTLLLLTLNYSTYKQKKRSCIYLFIYLFNVYLDSRYKLSHFLVLSTHVEAIHHTITIIVI